MGLRTVRYIVPAVLVVIGFVILFTAGESLRWEGWAMCVGAGLAILLLNVLYRYGASGDRERTAEDEARRYFSEHGRWPDED
jgi:chromate transport protein ChrA